LNHHPPNSTLLHIQALAERTAREAGDLLLKGFEKPMDIKLKGQIDLVTEYDLASEQLIKQRITAAYPDHAVLAEESGGTHSGSPCRWYIDPLDGTTNFAHGFPFFCISIAFEAPGDYGTEIQVGVVFDPLRQELFSAVKGGGTRLNNRILHVTNETDLKRALVATGFPYDILERSERVLRHFERLLLSARGIRRPGSAALDLAYLAAGRVDAFWEEGLNPWDTAAGCLLVTEAGGRVSDFSGNPFQPHMKEILATNAQLHYTMTKLLSEAPSMTKPSKAASPKGDHE
jgi:myo-inositol-1(or 4)-monophosphatase